MVCDAVWTLQVSSLLGTTYSIPWPPFYEKIIDAFAAINIDISMIRQVHCVDQCCCVLLGTGHLLVSACCWAPAGHLLVSNALYRIDQYCCVQRGHDCLAPAGV